MTDWQISDADMIHQCSHLIELVQADIEHGQVDESTALACTASDLLAASIHAHQARRLGLSAWLVEQASQLAVKRNAIELAAMEPVPDTPEGLE